MSDSFQYSGPIFDDQGEYVRKRRPRRRKQERGLPDSVALLALADAYLELQNRFWPELVQNGTVARYTPENVAILADDFRNRFLDEATRNQIVAIPLDVEIAAGYTRYSDDGSNPRSLAQQLKLILEKARSNNHFIPWSNVFADAAVTATSAYRRGYMMGKSALADYKSRITVLYIDEIGRASRDAIEALSLARFIVEQLDKRLIGVSDSFDSTLPHSKAYLQMFAMVQEMFIDQLVHKVNRGMNDAFDNGRNTGLPAFGFKLAYKSDTLGRPVFARDGKRETELVVAEPEAKLVCKAFELFAKRNRSPERIAKLFNRLKAGGSDSWDGSRIRKLLCRWKYIGVCVYRMSRQVRHRVTGKVTVVKRPRKDWKVRRERRLQIIPYSLWKAAKRRLKLCAAAWKASRSSPSRTEVYPTTLVRPICYKCKAPLQLGRSGKYASYCCPNGIYGKKGCDFRGYKTVRLVEEAVLQEVSQRILVKEVFQNLVQKANDYLSQEAKAPREDSKPLEDELNRNRRKLENLYSLVETQGVDALPGAHKRIADLESEQAKLKKQLRDMNARNAPPPAPLTCEDVFPYIERLRDLLYGDVAVAAPLLRLLTGSITVRPTGEKRGKRAVWEASFASNLITAMVEIDRRSNCPTNGTLEYLSTRSWTIPESHAAEIYDVPIYEELAAEFREMRRAGMSVQAMATRKQMPWAQARECLNFALTGVRPQWKTKGKPKGTNSKKQRYLEISAEVVRRHDVERQTFAKIARELKVSEHTVRRAYDAGRPDLLEAARQAGEAPKRPNNICYPKAVLDSVAEMVKAGERNVNRIAVETACGEGTVRRVTSEMGIKLRSAPKPKVPKKPKVKPEMYSADVVRMHDLEGLSFSEIGRRLNICHGTVVKAYDLGRPDIIAAAAASGVPPQRSNRSRLSSAEKATIHALIRSGESTTAILAKTGASRTTVNRERKACAKGRPSS